MSGWTEIDARLRRTTVAVGLQGNWSYDQIEYARKYANYIAGKRLDRPSPCYHAEDVHEFVDHYMFAPVG